MARGVTVLDAPPSGDIVAQARSAAGLKSGHALYPAAACQADVMCDNELRRAERRGSPDGLRWIKPEDTPMPPTKVMIIRHAEKPGDGRDGIGPDGKPDTESLTVPGWRRSGALVRFFAPVDGHFSRP